MAILNLARAAASPLVRGRPSSPPDAVLSGTIRAKPDRLRAYATTCGFAADATIPPTYPHVLAFGLVMRLMTRRDFPFALPGLVHVRNAIAVRRPLEAGEALTFHVRSGDMSEHPKGRTVDVLTSASVDGTECWTERSTYLHREKTHRAPANARTPSPTEADRPAEAAERPGTLPAVVTWDLPRNLGRRYARASGDWNPIHLSRSTARPFGYRRPIAHGMWTMARVLSAMAALPDAFTAEVTFAAPLPLPSRVEFATDGTQVVVRPVAEPDSRPHLKGTVTQQWAFQLSP